MFKKFITVFIIMSFASFSFGAQTQKFYSIRNAAMGGVGYASGNDLSVLDSNPALMNNMDGCLNILSFKAAINDQALNDQQKLFDFIDFIDENDGNESAIISKMKSVLPLKAKLMMEFGLPMQFVAGTPSFMRFADKWGFAVFNNSIIDTRMVDPGNPKIKMTGQTDIAGVLGFSRKYKEGLVPFDFDAGIALKYVSQVRLYNGSDGSDTYEFGAGDVAAGIDDIEPGTKIGSGIGFDMGFAADTDFTSLKNEKVGFVIKNMMTNLSGEIQVSGNKVDDYDSYIPMTYGIGYSAVAGFETDIHFINDLLDEIQIAVDFDINNEVSWFKKMHFGLESTVFNDILKLRLGNNQGNFTSGFSLDMGVFHLGYANYTEELERKVGINSVNYHMLEAGLSF